MFTTLLFACTSSDGIAPEPKSIDQGLEWSSPVTVGDPNYAVLDGGERAHNRVEMTHDGQAVVSADSSLVFVLSAADLADLTVVLFPPTSFDFYNIPYEDEEPYDTEHLSSEAFAEHCASEDIQGRPCAPALGIAVPLTIATALPYGPVDDWPFVVEFSEICSFPDGESPPRGAGSMRCRSAARQTDGSWAIAQTQNLDFRLGWSEGLWQTALVDHGNLSEGVYVEGCPACSEGGAHFNQWGIVLDEGVGLPSDQ